MQELLNGLSGNIYDYIDLIWVPVTWFAVHKHQRWLASAFVVTCLMTLRVQVELMESTGFNSGFMPVMDSNIHSRGLITYSIIILLFLILAHFSPKTPKMIFFAACLTIYVFAFCFSMLLMAL